MLLTRSLGGLLLLVLVSSKEYSLKHGIEEPKHETLNNKNEKLNADGTLLSGKLLKKDDSPSTNSRKDILDPSSATPYHTIEKPRYASTGRLSTKPSADRIFQLTSLKNQPRIAFEENSRDRNLYRHLNENNETPLLPLGQEYYQKEVSTVISIPNKDARSVSNAKRMGLIFLHEANHPVSGRFNQDSGILENYIPIKPRNPHLHIPENYNEDSEEKDCRSDRSGSEEDIDEDHHSKSSKTLMIRHRKNLEPTHAHRQHGYLDQSDHHLEPASLEKDPATYERSLDEDDYNSNSKSYEDESDGRYVRYESEEVDKSVPARNSLRNIHSSHSVTHSSNSPKNKAPSYSEAHSNSRSHSQSGKLNKALHNGPVRYNAPISDEGLSSHSVNDGNHRAPYNNAPVHAYRETDLRPPLQEVVRPTHNFASNVEQQQHAFQQRPPYDRHGHNKVPAEREVFEEKPPANAYRHAHQPNTNKHSARQQKEIKVTLTPPQYHKDRNLQKAILEEPVRNAGQQEHDVYTDFKENNKQPERVPYQNYEQRHHTHHLNEQYNIRNDHRNGGSRDAQNRPNAPHYLAQHTKQESREPESRYPRRPLRIIPNDESRETDYDEGHVAVQYSPQPLDSKVGNTPNHHRKIVRGDESSRNTFLHREISQGQNLPRHNQQQHAMGQRNINGPNTYTAHPKPQQYKNAPQEQSDREHNYQEYPPNQKIAPQNGKLAYATDYPDEDSESSPGESYYREPRVIIERSKKDPYVSHSVSYSESSYKNNNEKEHRNPPDHRPNQERYNPEEKQPNLEQHHAVRHLAQDSPPTSSDGQYKQYRPQNYGRYHEHGEINPQTENTFRPQNEYEGDERDYDESPQQNYKEPQQNYKEPQQNYKEPQQNYKEPQHNYKEPQQNYKEPQQNYNEPQQNYNEPQHEEIYTPNSDYKETPSPNLKQSFFKEYGISDEAKIIVAEPIHGEPGHFVADGTKGTEAEPSENPHGENRDYEQSTQSFTPGTNSNSLRNHGPPHQIPGTFNALVSTDPRFLRKLPEIMHKERETKVSEQQKTQIYNPSKNTQEEHEYRNKENNGQVEHQTYRGYNQPREIVQHHGDGVSRIVYNSHSSQTVNNQYRSQSRPVHTNHPRSETRNGENSSYQPSGQLHYAKSEQIVEVVQPTEQITQEKGTTEDEVPTDSVKNL